SDVVGVDSLFELPDLLQGVDVSLEPHEMLVRFTRWSPSIGDPPGDALSLDDRDDRVRLDLLKGVRMPAGPPDFQPIGSKRRSQAEMDAGVVLTQVAVAGFEL